MNALASRRPDLAQLNHVREVGIGVGRNCGYSVLSTHPSTLQRDGAALLLVEQKMNSLSVVDVDDRLIDDSR